jgi:hypothetical protein
MQGCNGRRRNQWSTRRGDVLRKIQRIATISRWPTIKPIIGDSTMKASVLLQAVQLSQRTAAMPPLATAAPAYPPIRACEELVGSASHQVSRLHRIAPISPAKITGSVTMPMSTVPLPTVCATPVPNTNAATKLKNAAQMTAFPGDSTRVDTTVAIEFAASWKPLM